MLLRHVDSHVEKNRLQACNVCCATIFRIFLVQVPLEVEDAKMGWCLTWTDKLNTAMSGAVQDMA